MSLSTTGVPPDPAGRAPSGPKSGEEASGLQFFGPDPGWRFVNPAELLAFRELLLVFAVRDLKVRYRQAVVGAAWALLQPVARMLIFLTLFGLLGRRPTDSGAPYAVTVYVGVLLWQVFESIVRDSTAALVGNRDLVTKVYFPRALLPAATALCALVDFAIASLVLVPLMLFQGVHPTATLVCFPLFVLLGVVAGLAAGTWLCALNALYRDIGHVVPFLLQVGFFVSPVIYETGLVPPEWRSVWALNPLVAVIEGGRWSLLSASGARPPNALAMLTAVVIAATLLAGGLLYLRRVERWIADRI